MREVDLIGRIETPITLSARMNANAVTTTNYNELGNKPKINGVTRYGDLTPEELGIFYGAPFVANTVAEMTNTDKVYVYTGSETGYVAGNWYYYNGSEWVRGGVYNSAAVQTDRTLTQEDKAADAKAVGDALAMKAGIIEDTVTGEIVSFVPDKTIDKLLDASLEMSPIQSLNGYDSPWPAGGGANKCAFPSVDFTLNGVRYYTENGTLHMSGTSSGETSSTNPAFNALHFKLPAGTYYFSRFTYPNAVYLAKVGESEALVTNNGSFTLSEETDLRVGFYIYNRTFSGETIPLSVTAGASAPSAYTPAANICPISGHTGAELIRTGKNLLPHKFYQFNSSQLSVGTDTSTTYAHYLKAGTYTLSASLMGQARWIIREEHDTANTNVGGTLISANPHGTFTINKDGMYRIWLYGSGITAEMVSWFQLELGSSATAYEPYDGDTYSVTFTDQGTVYGGTYDFVTGKLTVTHRLVELDTAWFWYKGGSQPVGASVISTTQFPEHVYNPADECRCSHFKKTTTAYIVNMPAGEFLLSANGASAYFCMPTADYTAADFRDYITAQKNAGTPITVYYELATPLEYTLSPQQLTTLQGQNVVWGNGTATVKYAADAKTYIDNKIAAAVAALS